MAKMDSEHTHPIKSQGGRAFIELGRAVTFRALVKKESCQKHLIAGQACPVLNSYALVPACVE